VSVCEIHTGPYAHAFHAKGAIPRAHPSWRSSPRSARRAMPCAAPA
jgi:hypothetical protein